MCIPTVTETGEACKWASKGQLVGSYRHHRELKRLTEKHLNSAVLCIKS